MNPQIQQILAMNKAGMLADEQAAQLIEEILKAEQRPKYSSAPGRGDAEPLSAKWHKAVSGSVAAIADCARSMHSGSGTDHQGNMVHLSHVEYPEGAGAIFTGNQIRMSKIHELDLERSELTDNRFDASKVNEVRLRDAKLTESHFTASYIGELTVDHGEVHGLELFSCKWSEVKITEDSVVQEVRIHSSVAKELAITGQSQWKDSSVTSSALSEVTLRRSRIDHGRMDETRASEVLVEGSEWNGVVTRGVGFKEVQFVGCRFEDVVFSAEGRGGKKWSWSKARFENCQLDRVLFSDCRTHHTIIRGVTLKDVQIRGADLSGLTLEGNEAFLRATGARRS
jgi:uncharacterized protein YjbI with pentapeptide repeats